MIGQGLGVDVGPIALIERKPLLFFDLPSGFNFRLLCAVLSRLVVMEAIPSDVAQLGVVSNANHDGHDASHPSGRANMHFGIFRLIDHERSPPETAGRLALRA